MIPALKKCGVVERGIVQCVLAGGCACYRCRKEISLITGGFSI